MKISIPAARDRLAAAYGWAVSERPVPDEWTRRAVEIGESPSRTYVAALLTAALARATTAEVDAQWLKVTTDPRSYSARGLCHKVLVPASDALGFSLGATGREPLNNQPFFRYDRIDRMDRVHSSAIHHRDLGGFGGARAEPAVLGVMRLDACGDPSTRLPVNRRESQARARRSVVCRLVDAVERLLLDDAEQGRRAQAVVAAAFDLIFSEIHVERVNSPSRHFPGDVIALIGG